MLLEPGHAVEKEDTRSPSFQTQLFSPLDRQSSLQLIETMNYAVYQIVFTNQLRTVSPCLVWMCFGLPFSLCCKRLACGSSMQEPKLGLANTLLFSDSIYSSPICCIPTCGMVGGQTVLSAMLYMLLGNISMLDVRFLIKKCV